MKNRFICILLALAMLLGVAQAESTPALEDVGLDLMGSSVHYPQLTGHEDAAVQEKINAALMAAGAIEERLNRMAMLLSSPVKLNVTYRASIVGDVLSCAFLADGAVENSRATQVWSAVTLDLKTGEQVPFEALFTDAEAAAAFIESYVDETVAPELSAHLASGLLTPLPEVFALDATGLTLYYPIEQFRTLSDKAGTVKLRWHELADFLPEREIAPSTRESLTEALQAGRLPGLDAALGQPMQPLIDRYALLTDPDIYEGGRMVALEDDMFRQAWVLTDALTENFDQSEVQGLRADRMQLGSLITGKTTQAEWRALLGEPDGTLAVEAARAEIWRIAPGSSDYYTLGDCRLRLHADESGVLRSIFLTN